MNTSVNQTLTPSPGCLSLSKWGHHCSFNSVTFSTAEESTAHCRCSRVTCHVSRCHSKKPSRFKPQISHLYNGSHYSIYRIGLVGFNKRVEVKLPTWKKCHAGRNTGTKCRDAREQAQNVLRLKFEEDGKAHHHFVAIQGTQKSWAFTVHCVTHTPHRATSS